MIRLMNLPTKEDYDNFVSSFSKKISEEFPDTCFYIYGSYSDGRCDFGRSDIDGGLILNTDFITDKLKITNIANILNDCLNKNPVKLQFNLLDRGSNKDGRFLSHTKDYVNWIKRKGEIVCGPDYIKEMRGFDFKFGEVYAAAFNFRRIRNGLLYSINERANTRIFLDGLEKSLEGLVNLPKKLVNIKTKKLNPNREDTLKLLKEILPDIDCHFLEEVLKLFKTPERFYQRMSDWNKSLFLYKEALTSYESILKAYCSKFPTPDINEVRDFIF